MRTFGLTVLVALGLVLISILITIALKFIYYITGDELFFSLVIGVPAVMLAAYTIVINGLE